MDWKISSLLRRLRFSAAIRSSVGIVPAVSASAQAVGPRPCDLEAPATPCVAAFSTTRALYSA